jgi:predicted RNA-binding Zn-ribbon protein involved in translation (DUF1610 family)
VVQALERESGGDVKISKGKRQWLLAILDDRICTSCERGIVDEDMRQWITRCPPCVAKWVDRNTDRRCLA